jgi:hypothetical protein
MTIIGQNVPIPSLLMKILPKLRPLIASTLPILGLQVPSNLPALTQVTIDMRTEEHAISNMALGTNFVYAWHPDSFFSDGKVAHVIKDIGLGSMRWPGGAVTGFYHWDALIGHGWNDSWNPGWDSSNNLPPEDFMDLDEYLSIVDQTGIEIMLGVNMSSGKEWGREAEGIDEATRLMQYCADRGYDVKYIYFDNENYHTGNNYNRDDDGDGEAWTAASYGASFAAYAAAVKTVYPNAKLIANWKANPGTGNFNSSMTDMFAAAGDVIDYMDLHYYWEWDTASWDLWKSQKPMTKKGSSSTFGENVAQANTIFANLGYPNIRTAVLEWNIGPGPWQTDNDHTHFKTALMQTEMHLQFLQAGLDIGMLYTLESPLTDFLTTKHIIHNGEATATALWMWLFSKAGGNTVVQSSSNKAGVYIVALKGSSGELLIYLLNKTNNDETVVLNMSGYSLSDVSEAWRFHDGGNGLGALQTIGLWESAGTLRTTLRANTLNMIGLAYPAVETPGIPVVDIEIVNPIPAGMIAAWDNTAGPPDISTPGVEATLGGRYFDVDSTAGSTDGFFGTSTGVADTATGCITVRMDNGKNTVSLTVLNRTGNPLQLDSIHFDYAPWWAASPKDVALVYAGGDLDSIAKGTVINSVADLVNLGSKKGNYYDFDWSVTSLTDRVLAHNEFAVFNLVVSNITVGGEWANGGIDNIAIMGGSTPESGDAMILSWRSETGRKYTVMESSTLQPGDWQSASGTLIGHPGDMTHGAPFESDPNFIQIEIQP